MPSNTLVVLPLPARAIDSLRLARGDRESSPCAAIRLPVAGCDPDLVAPWRRCGNTRWKRVFAGFVGRKTIPVLRVQGSGWDLATIEPSCQSGGGLRPPPAASGPRCPSRRGVVRTQRQTLIVRRLPNPHSGALLQCLFAHTFIEPHPRDRLLALPLKTELRGTRQEVYGDRVALVPMCARFSTWPRPPLDRAYGTRPRLVVPRSKCPGCLVQLRPPVCLAATAEQATTRMMRWCRPPRAPQQAERRILPAAVPLFRAHACRSACFRCLAWFAARAPGPRRHRRWLLDCPQLRPLPGLVNDQASASAGPAALLATPTNVIPHQAAHHGVAGRAACPKPVASLY